MISKELENAINKQINKEIYSAYLYMSMAAKFEAMNLKGFSNWMTIQAQEEMTHAKKFYNYVFERGGRVKLDAIDKPPFEWKSALAVFEEAYKHECFVSKSINSIYDIAVKEKDHATSSMLKWFIDEQVEEEANADEIVQKLKLIKDNVGGLMILDQELSRRMFVDETQEGK